MDYGSLSYSCPDATADIGNGALPDISWNLTFKLGEHWAAEGERPAEFNTWAGQSSYSRRNAELTNVVGGFGIHCRVCALGRDVVDTDIREGHLDAFVVFGPNMMNGLVKETNISGYQVYLVTTCSKRLTGSLAWVNATSDDSLEGKDVLTNPCDCPHEMYEVHVTSDIPNYWENPEIRLQVVPVTSAGDPLHTGLMTHPIVDFYTTTTTTTTTTSTATNTSTTSSTTSSTSSTISSSTITSSTTTSNTSSTITFSTTTSSTSTTTTSTTSTSTATYTSTTTTTTTTSTTTTTGPLMDIDAIPPVTQICNQASFSGTKSRCQSGFGYPLIFQWKVGMQTPAEARGMLDAVLRTATEANQEAIVLSPKLLAAMAEVAGAETFPLHVTLTVINWEMTAASGSATMTVHTKDMDPILRAVGSTTVHLAHPGKILQLEVTTREQAPACNPLLVQWEYRSRLRTATLMRKEQWSEYKPFEDTGLQDESRLPNVVRLPSLSLIPDSLQRFRVTATFDSTVPVEKRRAAEYEVTVGPYPETRAVIEGPVRSPISCGFSLDASRSSDPMLPPGSGTEGLTFLWTCPSEACARIPQIAAAADGSGGASGPVLSVPGGLLTIGVHQFTVRVGRTTMGGAAEKFLAVEVEASGVPPAFVEAPWAGTGRMPMTAKSAEVVSTIGGNQISGQCTVPLNLHWKFALVDNPFRTPLLVLALLQTTTTRKNDVVTVATNEFSASILQPECEYAYVLLQTTNQTALDALMPAFLRDEAIEVAAISSTFVVDQVPMPGTISSDPLQGEAARTQFEFRTEGWFDEEVGSLQYAFYWFPLSVYYQLVGSDVSALFKFTVPDIEWDDADSPRYWLRLGGVALRSWSLSDAATAVLRAGRSFLVVRGRDSSGLISNAGAIGPTVAAPNGGLVVEEVQALLSTAISSNDAEQIWSSADAVASVMQSGRVLGTTGHSDEKSLRNSAGLVLAALERSLEVAETGEGSVEKLCQILTAVVGALNSLGGATVAEVGRAATVLTRALALVPATGLSRASGLALLGSLTALATDLFRGPAASASFDVGEAETLPRNMVSLASNLGKELLKAMRPGDRQELLAQDRDASASIRIALAQVPRVSTTTTFTTTTATTTITGSTTIDGGENSTTTTTTLRTGRSLQGSDGNVCETLGVSDTQWAGANPHRWANPQLGMNRDVPTEASVTVLEYSCGGSSLPDVPLEFEPPPMLSLLVGAIPSPPVPDEGPRGDANATTIATTTPPPTDPVERAGALGFWPCPVCLFFDKQAGGLWSYEGLRVASAWSLEDADNITELSCPALRGAGSYAMVYYLVPLGQLGPQGAIGLTSSTTTTAPGVLVVNRTAPKERSVEEASAGAAVAVAVVVALCFLLCGALAAAHRAKALAKTGGKVVPEAADDYGSLDEDEEVSPPVHAGVEAWASSAVAVRAEAADTTFQVPSQAARALAKRHKRRLGTGHSEGEGPPRPLDAEADAASGAVESATGVSTWLAREERGSGRHEVEEPRRPPTDESAASAAADLPPAEERPGVAEAQLPTQGASDSALRRWAAPGAGGGREPPPLSARRNVSSLVSARQPPLVPAPASGGRGLPGGEALALAPAALLPLPAFIPEDQPEVRETAWGSTLKVVKPVERRPRSSRRGPPGLVHKPDFKKGLGSDIGIF